MTDMTPADHRFMARAVEISRRSLTDSGKTPFGAIVVVNGDVVGEGTSSVVELHDATAHAEVMAIRHAGQALGSHLIENGTMYASSEPCPMCLMACYWARIGRLVYGATSHDVATYGFEDLQFYRDLAGPVAGRLLVGEVDEQSGAEAADVLRRWAAALPEPVQAKL